MNNIEKEIMEQLKILKSNFYQISRKGYIKGIGNNLASVGRTFENELGLSENSFPIADFNGIEIKTRRTYSKSNITLFTAVPDGDSFLEIERLKEKYGYPCKNDPRYKIINIETVATKKTFGGLNYQYKLDIDYDLEKLYLVIYDRNGYLKERLLLKLKYLVIINAWDKKYSEIIYFKYYKMDSYKLISFSKFIELLEKGIIH